MTLAGSVWKYGDNVDTDAIIPARYLNVSDPEQLGRHCLEDLDPSFADKVRPGDVIAAGENDLELPGFITIKIVDLKCDVVPKEYKYFLIDALLYSLVIYALTSPIIQYKGWSHPLSVLSALLIAVALGMVLGEVKNKEYTGLIFILDEVISQRMTKSSH